MQEPCEKGVVNHSAPSFAAGAVKPPLKRKQGNRWAGYRASKSCNRDADAVIKAEGDTDRGENASSGRSRVVVDPTHVWKLHAREPGDLGGA